MPGILNITAASAEVSLDSSGRGEMPFTVTNVGGRSIRVRVQTVVEEPAKTSWLALSGNTERDIPAGATQQFTVAVNVPPGTPAGAYSFRLDAVDVANPDDNYTQGPAVSITIALAPPQPKPFPWWMIAVVAVILIGGGLTIWKISSAPPKPVPEPPPVNPKPVEPPPKPATPVVLPAGIVSIQNDHTGLCLSPAGAREDNNAEVLQFLCDRDPSRMWTFQRVQDDVVQIKNYKSGKCLTVAGGNKNPDDPSVQFDCDQDPSRKWQFVQTSEKLFRLKNVNSGLCLTIPGGNQELNRTAVQHDCETDPTVEWRVKVP